MNTLILIEGLFGSGKSTTADVLSRELKRRGSDVSIYVESDPNNPVGFKMSLDEADKTIKSTTLASYPFSTWENLGTAANYFTILEARLIQNSSFWAMLNGESDEKCIELPKRILNYIPDKFDVKLIIFEQSFPEKHIWRVISERKKKHPYWLPYICDLFSKQAWSEKNNKNGLDGFLAAQMAWAKLLPRITNELDCNKLIIVDPQTNWEDTMDKVINFSLS